MKIKVSDIFNDTIYCKIKDKSGAIYHSLGFDQAKEFIDKAVERGEEIEFEGVPRFLEQYRRLEDYIKNIKKREKWEKR